MNILFIMKNIRSTKSMVIKRCFWYEILLKIKIKIKIVI